MRLSCLYEVYRQCLTLSTARITKTGLDWTAQVREDESGSHLRPLQGAIDSPIHVRSHLHLLLHGDIHRPRHLG